MTLLWRIGGQTQKKNIARERGADGVVFVEGGPPPQTPLPPPRPSPSITPPPSPPTTPTPPPDQCPPARVAGREKSAARILG